MNNLVNTMPVSDQPVLIPTILCGGSGSRLWPVSRELYPKPFIRVNGGHSLLQEAFIRGALLPDVDDVLTVANRELLFKIEDEYRAVKQIPGKPISTRFILEPFGRNTAPAIAAACLQVAEQHGEDAILLVLAADHLISDQAAFADAVAQACKLAQSGKLVTFGIQPTMPETGYGYIESNGHTVSQFIEKPSLEKAHEYLASGNFLWNSGMFCFTAGNLLREIATHSAQILRTTQNCLQHAKASYGDGFSQLELDAEYFELVPDDSIDYAVMEKTRNAAVVTCDIGWKDIGCWKTLGDLQKPDGDNNRIQGEASSEAILIDSQNCTIHTEDRMVGVIGGENLVIVDTADALLIADKQRTQDVRGIYAQLKAQDHKAHKLHRTVHRIWGAYTVLEEGPNFKIKRIEVKLGASISLQSHQHRSEHWVVVSGIARVFHNGRTKTLNINESTFIPAKHKHRLENIGDQPLIIIEVQTGDYLGEDDIVRFDSACSGNVRCAV